MFAPVVTALGECLAIRYTAYGQNLWRVAAKGFSEVVASGVMDDFIQNDLLWTCTVYIHDLRGTCIVVILPSLWPASSHCLFQGQAGHVLGQKQLKPSQQVLRCPCRSACCQHCICQWGWGQRALRLHMDLPA